MASAVLPELGRTISVVLVIAPHRQPSERRLLATRAFEDPPRFAVSSLKQTTHRSGNPRRVASAIGTRRRGVSASVRSLIMVQLIAAPPGMNCAERAPRRNV